MEWSSPVLVHESRLEYRSSVLGLVLEYRRAVLVLGLGLRHAGLGLNIFQT